MGNCRVDNYFNKQFGEIMEESREQRAFLLGWSRGLFELYKFLAETESVEFADKSFIKADSNKHLLKFIEMYKEKDSDLEKITFEYQQYKKSRHEKENINESF